jgi:predicted CXXCH cytochrome family protein
LGIKTWTITVFRYLFVATSRKKNSVSEQTKEEKMNRSIDYPHIRKSLSIGALVGLIAMVFWVTVGNAAPLAQQPTPMATGDPQTCGDCHLDIVNEWGHSPHAHAYDDPNFQIGWQGEGNNPNCLLCHTTNFQATSGTFEVEGVSCEACHGKVDPNHPPASVPIRADTEYCGTCHTTSLGEWRLTGHATADVGCTDCHDPHSQQNLFDNPDEMCLNCHEDSMGPYLEDLHVQKGIGCVDCHALVIPPEVPPADGIVPTGHTFTITPATCVACHTDALHSGFSLPGYENGATGATENLTETVQTVQIKEGDRIVNTPEEEIHQLKTQVELLNTAVASRNMAVLFQGAVVGIVLGGSTAWIVANNVRSGRKPEEDEEQKNDGTK